MILFITVYLIPVNTTASQQQYWAAFVTGDLHRLKNKLPTLSAKCAFMMDNYRFRSATWN